MPFKDIDPDWTKKYSEVKEFYEGEYDPKYFQFNKWEKEVDPIEPFEDIEEYEPQKQNEELLKCAMSFPYFCTKYLKIAHPKRGLVPFILYNYQRRVIKDYEDNRFCILSKFRQGGLTTTTVLWALWRCLFKLDETLMVLSKSDREAIAAGEIVKRALIELPKWMKPEMEKNNDHQKIFADTGCKLFFYTPEAARGRSITYLILDEAAFIPHMEKHWKAMFPTISTGGHCICISTVNGVGNWYYDIFQGAMKDPPQNDFFVIELDYWEHPDYDDKDWVKQTKAQLGDKGWLQEVMRDFLGAGESYISADIINEMDILTRDIEPIRKLFPDWNNRYEAKELRIVDEDAWAKGALHVWREPVEGRDYIIGVDSAEGMGEDNDNSCFEVIDAVTCEQCAEFYSNEVPPHDFSQVCSMIGRKYNNALIVVESQNAGLVVLEKLMHEFQYENLFESSQGTSQNGKNLKPGIKTTGQNRMKFIETMQTRLINKSIRISSRRFVKELKGFIWNRQKKKVEAARGFHDDAIMSLCLALYARESSARYAPVGVGEEEYSEIFKAEIFDKIRKELFENDGDWEKEAEQWFNSPDDHSKMFEFKRKNDSLLKEFGW